MKKSFYNNNNSNNLIKKKYNKKKNQNNNNIENQNKIKYNELNNQQGKKESLNNKNQIIYKFSKNSNIKQLQTKTAKCSPSSINNRIFKQITKIKNKQNINSIPTVIFNVNSNQNLDVNNKLIQNSNESKSNKSKSNDSNKNKKMNFKKTSNQCNLIKKNIKNENNYNNNIVIKTKTQIQKKHFKKNNINLLNHKNIINKNQIKDNNSYNNNTNPYNFYYTNNQKNNMVTSLSLSSNKNNLAGLKYNNFINNNNINTFKTTSITTKNSAKSSKEKNNHNSNNSHKNKDSNKIKKTNGINSNLVSVGPKKNIYQQQLIMQNNNKINSLMKKLTNSNVNKGNKKDKNKDIMANSKNLTLIGKNNNLNALSLNNFYSMNIFPKSNYFKTKLETKIQNNNNEFQRKNNKYFENLNNHNIFPITISNYKNNYININININNRKSLIKTTNNNSCNIKKIIKSKNNSKNKNENINKKKNLSSSNTKIINKIKYIKRNFNKNNNANTHKNNNLKLKELSCFYLKKINFPINLTSSLLQSESWGKSKEYKKTQIKKILPKLNNNDFCINDKEKKLINHNLTNNDNNDIGNIRRISIDPAILKRNDINNNTITTKNEFSTISQKDYNYYNEESLKLIEIIKKYGLEQNYCNYPKTNLNYYKIGRSIGHGAFGKVNIALHVLSGHIVAIKSFNKIKKTFPLNKIYYEIKLLKKLRNHKNIIKYFEHFENEKHFFIVMENIAGGNLLNAINKMSKFTEPMAKNIFKQLIETIKYLHNIGIVHRDIKPDNILMELDNTIKLCDFGVSKEVKEGQLLTDSCGTPAFVAPEILKDSPYNPFMADIWSSGVVLYAMVTGFFPFRGVNQTELHRNILTGSFPKLKDASYELKDLLNRILEVNPNKRINIDDILKHPWLNSDDIINKNICIFTRAEKIIYGKLKIDYRKSNKENILENFTYHNMETDYEEENQNIKTISFIKTPYNSLRPRDDEEDLFYDDVNIENSIMKFLPKVGEMSRLYEVHNNFDFDQEFIIAEKEYNNKQILNLLMSSKNNSYEDEKIKVEKKNKKENINNNNKMKEKNKILNEDKFNNSKDKNSNLNNIKIIKINTKAIQFVENFGYNRDFIIKSLQLNEINHAIATYYLYLSLLNE
jgi:serine/threonine protein kinase